MTVLGYPRELQDPDVIWRHRQLDEGGWNALRLQVWRARWDAYQRHIAAFK